MSARLPISAFIIACNEADRIVTTIASLRDLVEEIIIIDSGSEDDTVVISQSAGGRVVHHDWPGYGLQKRFGEDQCRHRWLLNLDADEELTPELAAEIRAEFAKGEPRVAGYILKVRDLLPGETKLAPFAHTNHCLRLYNKEKARFSDSPVHDSVIVREGETAMLAAPVLHRSFRSVKHALEKIDFYTTAQAKDLQKKGMTLPWLRLVVEFPAAFIKAYFLRGYIFRGRRGIAFATLYAYSRLLRIVKYLKLKYK